jgi:hypothetical protein
MVAMTWRLVLRNLPCAKSYTASPLYGCGKCSTGESLLLSSLPVDPPARGQGPIEGYWCSPAGWVIVIARPRRKRVQGFTDNSVSADFRMMLPGKAA